PCGLASVNHSGVLTITRPPRYRVDVNMPESGAVAADDNAVSTSPPAEHLGAGVVKRATRLADGRELVYYDDPDTTLGPDRAVDARTLDPRPETASMRLDVL